MRYLVDVEVESKREFQYSVEAATVEEAEATARRLAMARTDGPIRSLEVLRITEDGEPNHNDMTAHGEGYLKRLL